MNKPLVAKACLAIATSCLIGMPIAAQQAAAKQPPRSLSTMHVQVLLDRLGFGPGVIDGREGASLKGALRGFQTANGLPVTGAIDKPTLAALAKHRAVRPTVRVALGAADLSGPFVGAIPDDYAVKAKLPTMGYSNRMERIAERYHTTPETLIALNSAAKSLKAGTPIMVPNVVTGPQTYDAKLKPDWQATLAMLNVGAAQPSAARVVVDKSEGVLKVYDREDKLVAQFPATMGSSKDPLPLGSWKIQGVSYLPDYSYDPTLLRGEDDGNEKQVLKPGPNSPVGVVWMDLNKPNYGIHGTPSPETIGRAESNGCIRLSNWDAARLALMVKPGTPARFQA